MAAKETTTTYTWGEGNVIRRIDVRMQSNGRAVAYLYADNSEEARQKRQDIRSAIRLKGWGTLSDHRGGEFGLRVSGLKSGQELIDMLINAGFATPAPTISYGEAQDTQPKGLVSWVKKHSLRLSAAIYTIGDLFYFKGSDNKFDKGMALSFGFGDLMLGIFGTRDDNRQYQLLLSQLKNHMKQEGIEIPSNASIHVETVSQPRSFFGNISEFLHQHINSIKILSEVIGGGFVLRSGLTKNEVTGKRNPFNIVSGLVIMAGWAGALLVPEKKPNRNKEEPTGPVDKAIAYIQEKPLRLAGGAGLTFNALKITDNVLNKRASSVWSIGGVTSMIGANSLYAISSKTVSGDIKAEAMISDLYSVSAQILNKQPEGAARDSAIESTAKFLGERPEIKDTHQEIIERLKNEMAIQRQNPWFEKVGLPPKAQKVAMGKAPTANDNLKPVANDNPTTTVAKVQREEQRVADAGAALAQA